MNKFEAPALIAKNFPEADSGLPFVAATGNIDKAMGILSRYTRSLIAAGKFVKVQQCMSVADSIYEQGDTVVKNAVSNIYVFSFSLMSLCCNAAEWHNIQARIPFTLNAIYIKQITQSSC